MTLFNNILLWACDAYSTIIFIYVMMTWIPMTPGGAFERLFQVLGMICDPFLNLFRKIIPPLGGMVDVSPIIALLVLQFGVRLIISFL